MSFVKTELLGSLKDYQFIRMGTGFMALIRAIKIVVARQNYSRIWSPKCIIIKPNQSKLLNTFQCITKQLSYVCQLKKKLSNSVMQIGIRTLNSVLVFF